jgi:hypothetical protein
LNLEKTHLGSADAFQTWRKATPDESQTRGSRGLPVIVDLEHAGKRHVREPGDPVNAETLIEVAAAEAKPEGKSGG